MGIILDIETAIKQGDIDGAKTHLVQYSGERQSVEFFISTALVQIAMDDFPAATKILTVLAQQGEPASQMMLAILQRPQKLSPPEFFYQMQFERWKRGPYMEYPREITLETFTMCNAACVFCPYPTVDRKGNKMSDALLDKVVADMQEIPREVPFVVAPFKLSDPFMDKRMEGLCQTLEVKSPNAKVRIFTNGAPLTERQIGWVSELSNLEHLWISLNSHDAQEYEAIMKIPFDKTIAKMRMLHDFVEKNGFSTPIIVSKVGESNDNDRAFAEFVQGEFPLFTCNIIKRSDWLGQVDTYSATGVPHTGCARWFELSITSTGVVALCCMDGQGKYPIGNVNDNSLLEIYNHPDYKTLRADFLDRTLANEPCKSCNL